MTNNNTQHVTANTNTIIQTKECDQTEILRDNAIAAKTGNDLQMSHADGTEE